jgi:hypothetical protein
MISSSYLAISVLALDIKSFARCRMTLACISIYVSPKDSSHLREETCLS